MKTILFIKRRGIGDTVLSIPAIDILHKNFPDTKITLLIPKSVKPLLEMHPGIHEIWGFEEDNFLGLLSKIILKRFDLVLDLNCTGQTRILTKLSFAKQKYSHRHDEQCAKKYKPRPNGIEWDLYALEEAITSIKIPNKSSLSTKIYFWEEELEQAREFWRSRGVQNGHVVILGTSATRASKRWPSNYYARLAILLKERMHITSAILIGPEPIERDFANKVINDINAFQKNSSAIGLFIVERVQNLRNFAALLATASAYVGNDSGPKHIAIASGTPTLTFFGPEDPLEWHPYPFEHHPYLHIPNLKCRKEDNGRWCAITDCVVEKHRCMTDITPETAFSVFQKIRRIPGIHEPKTLVYRPPLPKAPT